MSAHDCESTNAPVAAYIGRQPIVDRAGKLIAYELLFRRGETNTASVIDDTAATGQVIVNAIGEFGVQRVLGDQRGFINVGRELLSDDVLGLLAPEKFVLEILETIPRDEILHAQCKRLRRAGFGLALDDVTAVEQMPASILELVEVVKIDYPRIDSRDLPRLIDTAHRSGARVLAEKVETAKEYRELHALGVDLFQGYFFAHPEMLSQRKLTLAVSDLMELVHALSANAPLDRIEPIIKRNPPLLMQLIKLASSGLFSAAKPVSTIGEAILRIGTRSLLRWIQLLLYAGVSDVSLRSNPLFQLVATRARFLELAANLVQTRDTDLPDRAYQVGIFSLMHLMLDMSSQDLMEQLAVAPDVRDAVVLRRGTLGNLLELAEMVESGREPDFESLPELDGTLAAKDVSDITAQAAEWVLADMAG
ncbi:EAL domain-containing protein [Paraburkholderia sp.]|uniref:EAL and HDOD domain-containing protein n=1 Tax=Paraburkholderia sp. TaxID=1926495 RepID=UPI0025D6262E|nr:EAL domain-containing protein [Paraburkholderia sp.]